MHQRMNPHTVAPELQKADVRPVPARSGRASTTSEAPVSLVEYGDYECPFCARADPVVEQADKWRRDHVDDAVRDKANYHRSGGSLAGLPVSGRCGAGRATCRDRPMAQAQRSGGRRLPTLPGSCCA